MGKQERGAPGDLWEFQEWLGLKLLPQMPGEEGLKAYASGLWQPSSVEAEGSFQLLPEVKGEHCWAGCSPALAYILYRCSMEGKPFPYQPVPPSLCICHLPPPDSASRLPLTPHLCPAFLPNPAPSSQTVPLTVLS